jgi:hypothetical protein
VPADLSGNQLIDWGNIFAMSTRSYVVSVWTRPDGTTNTGYVAGKTTGLNGWYCRRNSGDPSAWEMGHISGGTTTTAIGAAGTVSSGSAQNLIIEYDDATNDVVFYKNNSSIATNTAMTDQAATSAVLGVGNRGALDRDYDGLVWDFAVWLDIATIGATNRANIAAGASALFCSTRPSLYAPLVSDTIEVIGPTTGTNTGSVTFTANTNIIFPPVHTMYRRLHR